MPYWIGDKIVYEPDMEPVSKPYKLDRPTCPVCGNTYPEVLYKNDYNEVLGGDECVVVQYVDD